MGKGRKIKLRKRQTEKSERHEGETETVEVMEG